MGLYFYDADARQIEDGAGLTVISEVSLRRLKKIKGPCVGDSYGNVEFRKKAVPGFVGKLKILDPIYIGKCRVLSIEDKLVPKEVANTVKERISEYYHEKWVILQLLDYKNKIMAIDSCFVAEVEE